MGWQDRQYYRDGNRSSGGGIRAILNGSVPLFTAFNIRVRAHASLLFLIGMVILFDATKGYPIQDRAVSMGMLALAILLHEFGHCFMARAVGGEADEILMWPLGGLAMVSPPQRPLPVFLTAAAGPAVDLAVCVVCGVLIWLLGGGVVSLNPFHFHTSLRPNQVSYYLFWFYLVNYTLLLFNTLPIFPMDFGQMLQAVLWPKLGYRKSLYVACVVGLVGSAMLAFFGVSRGSILLICIAISCFLYCRSKLTMLKETAEEDFLGNEPMDFSDSLRPDKPARKRKRASRWLVRRLRRQVLRDAAEQQLIDNILAKVSAHGIQSLGWSERRALRRATERQRQRELEISHGK